MSTGWSWYVIALVVLNIIGCAWLLWWTGRRRPGDPGPTDTSHVWDGDLTEYNKPLPRWWINLFYLTIVFSVGYLVWYGGFGSYAGMSAWSSTAEHDLDKARHDAILEQTFAAHASREIPALARDPEALALGRSIFANTCATCHGSSAGGATGYPNLSDDVWHWGGEPEQVLASILDGREGVMPPWGTVLQGMGGEQAVTATVAYVRSLSNPGASGDWFAARGKQHYDGLCAACHAADGGGNASMGAPDLTDRYWMYGGSSQAIRASIVDGRHGIMPAHRELLGETRARLVAAYVWSLSNGSATAAAGTTGSGDAAP